MSLLFLLLRGNDMEIRKGYVEHIVFRNKENGYTVFQLIADEEELTCVGCFSVLSEGEFVQVSGVMKEHPLYGEQLQRGRTGTAGGSEGHQ